MFLVTIVNGFPIILQNPISLLILNQFKYFKNQNIGYYMYRNDQLMKLQEVNKKLLKNTSIILSLENGSTSI